MPKKCPDDKILNPETNRCVKRDGKIGKKILKEEEKKKKSGRDGEKKPVVKNKNCSEELTDYTKLSNKISSIKGKEASSSSTSDIYVLTLEDRRQAYMKVFSIGDDVSHMNLKYEFSVYALKVKFLSLISPNFVTPIAGKVDTNYHEIINYLENKVKDEKTNSLLSRDELTQRFHRNITLANISELKKVPVRPSIGRDMYENKYGYIVTGPSSEDMDGLRRVTSFKDFIKNNYNLYETKLWEFLTQIAVACYLMNLTGLVHNDLHPGNILVYVYDNPKNIQYILGTVKNPYIVRINTPFIIKIYDFDRSNMSGQYENRFTPNMLSSGQDQLNIEMKDFVKAICYLQETRAFNKAKLVLKDTINVNEYNKLLDRDCFFNRSKLSNQEWRDKFKIFRPINEVLKLLGKETEKFISPSSSILYEKYDLRRDTVDNELGKYEYDLFKVCKAPVKPIRNFLNL